jgi:acyl-CoA dehydrogenase
VPKFFVGDDGTLGERNDVFCSGLEHKLGIHASPTCTMIYGDGKFGDQPGAIGWLIGEENRGLACMFTMMNNARLAVGMQGVAIAETAYQKALAYARERTQGRAPGFTGEGMSPIIEHPDVARMLMTMKALTQGARAICYSCAEALDMAACQRGRGSQGLVRTRKPDHPDRQGVCHRCRHGRCLARHPGAWRHGLHRGNRCRDDICAMPA